MSRSASVRRGWGIASALVLLAAGAAYYQFRPKNNPAIELTPQKVQRGDLLLTILSTGVVQPENRLEIKPPIPGRAEQVLVEEGQRVKKGQILVWMSSIERAALLDAAQARGPEELKRWQEMYRPTPVLAPLDGTIILRNVEPGQTFSSNDSILSMSDHLAVQAQVDETDIAQIETGQQASIVLDAYPKDPIPGRVEKIAYDAKTVNNVTTYIVDVLPKNTPAFMRSGMTANVSFQVGRKSNVLLIPTEAVKTREGRSYVQLPASQNRGPALEREIQLGLSNGKQSEVVAGLIEGELVLQAKFKVSEARSATPTSNPLNPMPPRRPH